MAYARIPPRSVVPQGTGLTNLNELLLESARKELAYHMSEFKKSADEWHREKIRKYRIIVRHLVEEVGNGRDQRADATP